MFSHRLAEASDLPALKALMARSIAVLQREFLSEAEIQASQAVMGLDTQLITDGTYFLVELDGQLAGCGGWSWRSTLYGGDHSTSLRNPAPLDPAIDAARIRGMYTDPHYARRGVGRQVLALCEAAARAAGFKRTQLMATLAGEPLYKACGYTVIEHILAPAVASVSVPLILMGRALD